MEEFDKGEAATPQKLKQARERGNVARSTDMTGAVVLMTSVVALYGWGWEACELLMALASAAMIQGTSQVMTLQSIIALVQAVGLGAMGILAPFMVAVASAAVIGNVMQTGFVWSGFPIKPDFNRINPAAGLKRLFSLRTMFDALKSILKITVLGVVLYLSLKAAVQEFFALGDKSTYDSFKLLVSSMAGLGIKMALAALLLAFLDLGYTRFDFARKMRMSKRDVRDEVKNREGDPRVRSRLRGLRAEMRKKSAAVSRVGQADVLIVNPTHFAVALKYERGAMAAPVLLAKGAGGLAQRMRREAARHSVPVVRNQALARALYFRGDLSNTIPEVFFEDVARIIVWVIASRRARAETAEGAT